MSLQWISVNPHVGKPECVMADLRDRPQIPLCPAQHSGIAAATAAGCLQLPGSPWCCVLLLPGGWPVRHVVHVKQSWQGPVKGTALLIEDTVPCYGHAGQAMHLQM